jgi:hypothetical protein
MNVFLHKQVLDDKATYTVNTSQGLMEQTLQENVSKWKGMKTIATSLTYLLNVLLDVLLGPLEDDLPVLEALALGFFGLLGLSQAPQLVALALLQDRFGHMRSGCGLGGAHPEEGNGR